MSLILEALKKLERDKQVPDRGFLVLAHLPWVRTANPRARVAAAAVLTLLVALAGLLFWHARSAPTAPAISAPRPPVTLPPVRGEAPLLAPLPDTSATASAPPPSRTSTVSSAPEAPPAPAVAEPPLASTPAAGEEFRLNAITVQDGHPVAVLNDRIVREGDSFEGVRIVRIGETEVEIEVKGKRRVIRF